MSNVQQAANSSNLTSMDPTTTPMTTPKVVLESIRLIFFGAIFVLGTVGNALVILAYRNPRMRSVTNLFIANLGVADLTVSLINVPVATTISLISHWPFGLVLCKGIPYLLGVTIFSSVGTLVAIATDRYRAIVHPLLPRIRTRHAITMIVAIWIVASIYPIPLIIYQQMKERVCEEDWPSTIAPQIYTVMIFVALYLIPLIAISVLYSLISHNLRTSESTAQAGARRAKKSVIRMLMTVVLLFAACWLPFHIVFLYINFGGKPGKNLVFFTQWLMFANSACNPIVYAVFNRNYRREFGRIIRCQSPARSKYIHCDSTNERYKFSVENSKSSFRGTTKARTKIILRRKSNTNEDFSVSEVAVQNGHTSKTAGTVVPRKRSVQGVSSSGLGQSFGDEQPQVCFESGF